MTAGKMCNPVASMVSSAESPRFSPKVTSNPPRIPMSVFRTSRAVTTAPPRTMTSRSGMFLGQEFQEAAEDADGYKHVRFVDGFVRMMADPILATHEQHRHGCDGGKRGGVVAGAAGQFHDLARVLGRCLLE